MNKENVVLKKELNELRNIPLEEDSDSNDELRNRFLNESILYLRDLGRIF